MSYRISPLWWPILAAGAPILAPWLAVQAKKFRDGEKQAAARNAARLRTAKPLALPELKKFDLTVVVEHRAAEGFVGAAAVSYLLRTAGGAMLMDVGFGPEGPALRDNAARLGIGANDWNALFVSHLHPDHMGGMTAARQRAIRLPSALTPANPIPCYSPAPCAAPEMNVEEVTEPRTLRNGLGSSGPLARMLCFEGLTEEQAVVAKLKNKGLVVIMGCGHPTVEVVLQMTRRLSDAPVYAVIGGLHLPIAESRWKKAGLQLQQLAGTGKPWWRKIDDRDLDAAIRALRESGAKRLLLSAHDTCDYALKRIADSVSAQVDVLTAGVTYSL